MFVKLLKHDFAAISRILLPLHAGVIVLGIIGFACFFALSVIPGSSEGDFAAMALIPFGALVAPLCLIAIAMAPVATLIVVAWRFYSNLFTDQGYLTLTLPATANQHIASKFVAGSLWFLLDTIIVLLCLVGAAMGIFSEGSSFVGEVVPVILQQYMGSQGLASVGQIILFSISGILSLCLSVLMIYLAFTLGAVLSSRHKVAAGVGLYLGLTFVYSTVVSIVSLISVFLTWRAEETLAMRALSLQVDPVSLVLTLVLGVGLYLLCTYLLKSKVNLV